MNDQARQALLDLRGKELTRPLLEATLADRCPDCPAERAALLAAWDHGVFRELGTVADGDPKLIPTRLAERLQKDAGLTSETAWWAVGAVVRFYGWHLGEPERPPRVATGANVATAAVDSGSADAHGVSLPALAGGGTGGLSGRFGWAIGGLVGAFFGMILALVTVGDCLYQLVHGSSGELGRTVEDLAMGALFCSVAGGVVLGAVVGARFGRHLSRNITATIEQVYGAGAEGWIVGGLSVLTGGSVGACCGAGLGFIACVHHAGDLGAGVGGLCLVGPIGGVAGAYVGAHLAAFLGQSLGRGTRPGR